MKSGGGKEEEEDGRLEGTVSLQRGKLTLIKSSLASIPVYFLSLFVAPKSVCFMRWKKISF